MERCIISNSCDDEQKERMNNVEESLSAKSEGTGNGNFENTTRSLPLICLTMILIVIDV